MLVKGISDSANFTSMAETMRVARAVLRSSAGVTVEQFRIMGFLCGRVEGASSGEITTVLMTVKSAVSMSVRGLEKMGCVIRAADAQGARTNRLALSSQGEACYRSACSAVMPAISTYLNAAGHSIRETLDHFMVLIAEKAGSEVFVQNEFDMCLAYMEVCSKTRQIFTRTLRGFGLSANEYRILNELVENEGRAHPGSLSKTLLIKRLQIPLKRNAHSANSGATVPIKQNTHSA
jgi:DNA-binding MarR family transcriptional regulator